MTEQRNQTMDDLLANPFDTNALQKIEPTTLTKAVKPIKEMDRLSEEEQAKAKELASQIPTNQTDAILTYGANAQAALSTFSNKMLDHVQAKDAGEVGSILSDLMNKLNEINPDELQAEQPKGLKKLFSKVSKSISEVMSKYQKLSTQIDRIAIQLEHSKNGLVDDVRMLDQLYDQNKTYFEALNIYIAAAELKRDELVNEIIPRAHAEAQQSDDQMKVQEVNDLNQFVDRLEKRMYDLQLSRQITLQSAPQIRMIQSTNQTLAEKIQSSIMTSIPLWRNQIAIALTLNNQRKAVEAQRKVTETTNELLLRNSEMLKMNTIETAKENERGIVEIETLKITQDNLVQTIAETLEIQAEGREKRRLAEIELAQMEQDLKQRLLQLQYTKQEQERR
ncbi:toxic anion resistance protein [Kurthia senegalensis]|uniref:toxic anion resistance protein n=1 Tax=Kurthia senegalensis TaxID=1033740 RepID=UPI0002896FEC|nr:toxic anion resistance protein [Kurthia senegalensis]